MTTLRATAEGHELRDLSRDDAGMTIRSAEDAPAGFVGHAAVFNKRAAIGNPFTWGFYEQIAPGAFTRTIANTDVRFLVDHDSSKIVARMSAGDLRLSQDDIGLAVDADLDLELSYVRDLKRNIETRRITGMSFGFTAVRDEWQVEQVERDGKMVDVEVRTVFEAKLPEVSAVTFPAYEETTAAVRALSLRNDPDPFGRRAHLLDRIIEQHRDTGESTRGHDRGDTGESTRFSVKQADDVMQALAALTGLRV